VYSHFVEVHELTTLFAVSAVRPEVSPVHTVALAGSVPVHENGVALHVHPGLGEDAHVPKLHANVAVPS
jgi:hypothetical protein